MKGFAFLLLGIIVTGCTQASHTPLKADEMFSGLIDTEISCADFPEDTCAIQSEFQELADRAFAKSTPEDPQHFVSILDIGQDALLARLHLIRAAKKSIDLQTYIWANDEVGQLVFHELMEAARRGVKVRLIVDQVTITEDPVLLARLATAHKNLEISFYNPTFSRGKTTPLTLTTGALFSFRKINQRMHNKVLIIDERIGIVGGRNIENKYYDYSPEYNFKDRDVIVIGPAVTQMGEFFERYWSNEVVVKAFHLIDVGQEIKKLQSGSEPTLMDKPDRAFFSDIDSLANDYSLFKERPAMRPLPISRVKYTADLPGKPTTEEFENYEDSSAVLREIMTAARKSITIQTPYFVLSRTALKKLKKMRKENPDLQMTVSSNSLASTDLFMIYAITFKQKRKIIKNLKMNLHEFKPFPESVREYIPRYDQLLADYQSERYDDPLNENVERIPVHQKGPRIGMHAKSIVVDSTIAIIGSHNFDPRSISINTESAVIIWDEGIARDLEQNILVDIEPQNSWVIAKRQKVPLIGHFSEAMGSIFQMLPVFDIWPFRYSTNYQLREEMEPLPASHPDFYKHYENVGQFPEVNMSVKSIQTRMFKAFGGFAAPLM
jgi:phosphatidylserine/phosphatidylglycerophosphate/cardiolipin synthase-like enzyme